MDNKEYKNLGFWIGLLCAIIVIVEVLLNLLGVEFETKVIIEVVSFVLAMLVSMGVLKGNKDAKDVNELKKDIQTEIENKSGSIKSSITKTSSAENLRNKTNTNNKK